MANPGDKSPSFEVVLDLVFDPSKKLADFEEKVPSIFGSAWISLAEVPDNMTRFDRSEIRDHLLYIATNLLDAHPDWHLSRMFLPSATTDEEFHQNFFHYMCLALFEIHLAISFQNYDDKSLSIGGQASSIVQALLAFNEALKVCEPMDISARRIAWEFGAEREREKLKEEESKAKSRIGSEKHVRYRQFWAFMEQYVNQMPADQKVNNITEQVRLIDEAYKELSQQAPIPLDPNHKRKELKKLLRVRNLL